MQDRTRELKLLNSVAAVVSGRVGIGGILAVSLEKTMEAFGIEAGGAYGLEEESGTLVMLAHKGLSPGFVHRPGGWTSRAPWPPGSQLRSAHHVGGDGLSRRPPAAVDRGRGPEVDHRRAARGKTQFVGGLVLNTRGDRALSSEEESLLIAIGQQVGLAIENARLLELERVEHAEAPPAAGGRRGTARNARRAQLRFPLQQTLNFIISQACRLMQCDASSLFQPETPGRPLSIRASCGLPPGYVTGARFSPARGGAGGPSRNGSHSRCRTRRSSSRTRTRGKTATACGG